MESSFSSFGSADNKGILSLLSAIEQTGDNFDTDSDSPGGEQFSHSPGGEQFSNFSLGMGFGVSCLVCGEMTDDGRMVDIYLEELAGRQLCSMIEEIVARKIVASHQSSLICEVCHSLLKQIQNLEMELLQHKRALTTKYSVSNPIHQPVKSRRLNKKLPVRSRSNESNNTSPNISSMCEPLDFSEPVIDAKMPLQFLAGENDQDSLRSHKLSNLEILAETMQSTELSSGPQYSLYNSIDQENNKVNSEFQCQQCDKVFKSNTMLLKHQKIHQLKSFSCIECDKSFTTRSNLMAHLKTHQDIKTFGCPHCSREFKGKKSLLEHISAKHNQDKKFPCALCPESFLTRHLKNVHEREHNGEKGYICDQCGESFATVQGLSHHKSRHTGDYQFRCQACDKGFNNYKLLEEHNHIHTGSKPYHCDKCDKGFANRGSLWIHMKQHDNSKPYVCGECSKSFTHSSHLAVHKRIHSGEKPYRCRLCGEGFISSNHLKRHMKSHANQLPFACAICKQTFSQRRQLISHSNKVHGGNVIEDTVDLSAKENVADDEEKIDQVDPNSSYNILPVSIIEESSSLVNLGEGQEERLVDLLGQDGVSLGQTIVLIQMPEEKDQEEG